MQSDPTCPHCGEVLRAKAGPRPSWVLFSLALAGCPAEDLYGCPDGCDFDTGSETASETNAETSPETGETGDETDTGETETG